MATTASLACGSGESSDAVVPAQSMQPPSSDAGSEAADARVPSVSLAGMYRVTTVLKGRSTCQPDEPDSPTWPMLRVTEETSGGAPELAIEECLDAKTHDGEWQCMPLRLDFVTATLHERTETGWQGDVETIGQCGCTNFCWVDVNITRMTASLDGGDLTLRWMTNAGRIEEVDLDVGNCRQRSYGVAFEDPRLDEECALSGVVEANRVTP
jgi:hypothetical protein